ncbi:MAG: DEAD/DEAH box helicase [Hyphomonadaceae bacterium]|nr:DEAD/DEAH box helicase [Hyphomonadaceae bacterium]
MPFPAVHPALAQALAARQYLDPTPVQAAVLEAAGAGDLLVSAQTGSGKTVAFGLAIAATLLGEAARFDAAGRPLALIIAPTRELAQQVCRELEWLYAETGARVISCVGGMDARREARQLNGGAHIVVGTPGRLRDHLERGALDVSSLRVVVLDEADEMLDLGFREDLQFMLEAMPEDRRTLLFSATIPKEIAALAKRFQRDAQRIDTVARNQPHADIEYHAVRTAPNDVEHAVVNLLRYHDVGAALVFCGTREGVKRLHAALLERGFAAVALSGEFSQNERNHALQSLRDGRSKVCVATDVAARGLDLPDLGLVIHADLPVNRDTLLHRSGRTGRAGRKGLSVLLAPHTRRRQAERLLDHARVDAIWTDPPTPEEIRARDVERLVKSPIFDAELSDDDQIIARALTAAHTPERIASAFARFYREQLPAPEDLIDTAPMQVERPARGERGDRFGDGVPMVRFRMNAGRFNNADPRWLIPLICRLGHVTKREIGAIRIFERETMVEIAEPVAGRFMAALRRADDPEVRIEPMDDAMARPAGRSERPPSRPRPPRSEGRPAWRPEAADENDMIDDNPRDAVRDPARKPKREHAKPFSAKPRVHASGMRKPGAPNSGAAPAGDGPSKPPRARKPFGSQKMGAKKMGGNSPPMRKKSKPSRGQGG